MRGPACGALLPARSGGGIQLRVADRTEVRTPCCLAAPLLRSVAASARGASFLGCRGCLTCEPSMVVCSRAAS